jgi:hypothetical protein
MTAPSLPIIHPHDYFAIRDACVSSIREEAMALIESIGRKRTSWRAIADDLYVSFGVKIGPSEINQIVNREIQRLDNLPESRRSKFYVVK